MTGAGSGGGGGYDYVEAFYPSDAEEGESLYHLTENAAFVYSGSEWIEQTVTDHSQLSGVNEGDHRSDQRVSDLAPVQTRYADSEARTAVDGSNVSVGYADDAGNADKLDGLNKSDFARDYQIPNVPNSTGNNEIAGGWVQAEGYINGAVADAARLPSDSPQNDITVELSDGRSFTLYPGDTENFDPGVVVDANYIEIHTVVLAAHSHPI